MAITVREARNHRVDVRMNDEEMHQLKMLSGGRSMTKSEYIRYLIRRAADTHGAYDEMLERGRTRDG